MTRQGGTCMTSLSYMRRRCAFKWTTRQITNFTMTIIYQEEDVDIPHQPVVTPLKRFPQIVKLQTLIQTKPSVAI